VKRDIRLRDLLIRTDYVTRNEIDVTLDQIQRNRIELLSAEASFVGPTQSTLNTSMIRPNVM